MSMLSFIMSLELESASSTSSTVGKDNNSSQEAKCPVPIKAEGADAELIFLNYVSL